MAHDQHDDAASAPSIETTDIPKRKSRIRTMIFPLVAEIGVVAALAVAAVYFVSDSHAEPESSAPAVQTPQPVTPVRLDQQSNAQSSGAQSGDAQSAAQSGAQPQEAPETEAEAAAETDAYTPWVEDDDDDWYYQPDTNYYYAPPADPEPVDTYVPEPAPEPEPVQVDEPVAPVDDGGSDADTQQSE